jgi:apolipoprotein N-acyltransferase
MGITTGILPAAALLGLLLGFGIRAGRPLGAFSALGIGLLGAGALGGVILVVVLMLMCGVGYVTLVARKRQHRVAWAMALAVAATVVMLVCMRLGGGEIALVLSSGNLIEIAIVIAIALPMGMRFALPQV